MQNVPALAPNSQGVQILTNSDVVDVRFVDVQSSRFWSPDAAFTGYGASGYFYSSGALDPDGGAQSADFQASWAVEGSGEPSTHRSDRDSFPPRLLVVATSEDVTMLDADSLSVWMRFVRGGSGYGTALGTDSVSVRSADFVEGWLLIATDEGLRAVDFINNRMWAYLSGAGASGDDITDRNVPGSLTENLSADSVVSDDCRIVRGSFRRTSPTVGVAVAAVGHDRGLTGVQLPLPWNSHPTTVEHDAALLYGDWETVGTGATTTRFVAGDDWSTVRYGDRVVTDTDLVSPVDAVDGDSLTLRDALTTGASGAAYEVVRPVEALTIRPNGDLVFACGHNLVRVTSDWYDGTPLDLFSISEEAGQFAVLPEGLDVQSVSLVGAQAYFGAERGVTLVDLTSIGSTTPMEYLLEPGQGTLPEGTLTCAEVDVEAGSLWVALDGDTPLIAEIALADRAQLQSTELPAAPTALCTYRNPSGPPTVEVV
jgi:hypothetical protein